MFEVFLVSIIYWTSLLVVFIWLNRRLSSLKERIVDLEVGGSEREKREEEK